MTYTTMQNSGCALTTHVRNWAARARGTLLAAFACASLAHAQPALQITSPADGSTVTAGQNLTVTVAASGGIFDMVLVIGEDPIGFSPVLAAPPYQFTFTLPSNLPARTYTLTAAGTTGPGQGVRSTPVSIKVEPSANPLSLSIEPSILKLWTGRTAPLQVIGTLGDGSKLNITESAQTTFTSTAPAVATVSSTGFVTAVGPGSAWIVVNNSYRVPVTVPPIVNVVPQASRLYPIGSTGLYTAPAAINSVQQVTITGASVADNTKSASATLTLYPPVSVAVAPGSASLRAGQRQQFAATVTNAPINGVTWSISLALGTITQGGSIYRAVLDRQQPDSHGHCCQLHGPGEEGQQHDIVEEIAGICLYHSPI